MTASSCSIAIGPRSRARPRAPSCCSTAATSIPAAWRIWPTSSTCRISPCSPGMRAATAAPPASAASARASAPRCATCRPSSITSRRATASRSSTSRWSRKASARCWSSTWAHDYAPKIRCMVLASPAFKVKLYVPFARQRPQAAAQVARELLRQFLRQGAIPHPRSRAHRLVPVRSADRASDRRQHPARPLRRVRARRGRRARHHGADPAVHLGRRLGRAPRPAAPLLRAAGDAHQGTPRPARASFTTPSASSAARSPSPARASSSSTASPSRPSGPRCSTPTA